MGLWGSETRLHEELTRDWSKTRGMVWEEEEEEEDDDDNDDDDDEHDDRDQNGHNSANFQAKCSKFCMAIHPVSTHRLMIMILMILMSKKRAKLPSGRGRGRPFG